MRDQAVAERYIWGKSKVVPNFCFFVLVYHFISQYTGRYKSVKDIFNHFFQGELLRNCTNCLNTANKSALSHGTIAAEKAQNDTHSHRV